MTWRDSLLCNVGPGLLVGITFGDWVRLLRDNRLAISPSFYPRAATITCRSIQNSAARYIEAKRYGALIKDTVVPPPLFLLGHWRSGTTHLHNLLAVDGRFAVPTTYQALHPHTFLTTETVGSRMLMRMLPKQRPMDNMPWSTGSPQEDEFALNVATFKSPYGAWVFPHRRDHYDRYLTLRNASETEVKLWKETLLTFLKKLTFKDGRPLVLKSPPHTCRIKLLLQMFPDARFVHIHRNPFAVFPSSKHTFRFGSDWHGLQRARTDDLDDWITRQYREMHDVFFEERDLIPAGRIHEMAFEDLEADPLRAVRRMYEVLGLPDFAYAATNVRAYLVSIADYKKNEFTELEPEQRRRLASAWQPSFAAWGYSSSG